jgi:hypothetical protein
MAKRWSEEEDAVLRELYEDGGWLEILVRLPGRARQSITGRANYLGLYRRKSAAGATRSGFDNQQSILEYIIAYRRANDLPPTIREIADACYLSTTTVFYHLGALENEGYIERCGHRGIKVTGGRWVYDD